MTDVTRLIQALEGYRRELEYHNRKVSDAYDQLEKALSRLNAAHKGAAASEYQSHWRRTKDGLKHYNEGAKSIQKLLDSRLEALKQVDRTEGL